MAEAAQPLFFFVRNVILCENSLTAAGGLPDEPIPLKKVLKELLTYDENRSRIIDISQ